MRSQRGAGMRFKSVRTHERYCPWSSPLSKSASTCGHTSSPSPTTTASACCITSLGRSVACGPPITTATLRLRNSRASAYACGGRRVGRDANKVQLFVEIHCLNDLVRVPDVPMLRSVSCEEWHGKLRKPDQSPVPHEPRCRRFCCDQFDPVAAWPDTAWRGGTKFHQTNSGYVITAYHDHVHGA